MKKPVFSALMRQIAWTKSAYSTAFFVAQSPVTDPPTEPPQAHLGLQLALPVGGVGQARQRRRAARSAPVVCAAEDRADAATRRRAVVIGAGPTGGLAALYLARQGDWDVTVSDKRAGFAAQADRGSFNIVINGRGRRALAGAGVDLPEGVSVPLEGNVRHSKRSAKFGKQFVGTAAVGRGRLAELLFEAARAQPAIRHRLGPTGEIASFSLEEKKARALRSTSRVRRRRPGKKHAASSPLSPLRAVGAVRGGR